MNWEWRQNFLFQELWVRDNPVLYTPKAYEMYDEISGGSIFLKWTLLTTVCITKTILNDTASTPCKAAATGKHWYENDTKWYDTIPNKYKTIKIT